MPTLRMLLALLAALAAAVPVAAQPDAPQHRLSSPVLRRFGSEAGFRSWLDRTRAEAHRLGDWWYAALRVQVADASGEGRWGLEILPGTHGEYDVREEMLANGDQLYYSRVDLTIVRPGVEPVWPGV